MWLGLGMEMSSCGEQGLLSQVWDCLKGILVSDELLIQEDVHVLQGSFQAQPLK